MAIRLSDITIGAKAEIETYSPLGPQGTRIFTSFVDGIDEKAGEIRVLAPIDMLTGYRIHAGDTFSLFAMSGGTLYQLRCRAIGYERSNKAILLVARLVENSTIENANRRNEFRVKTLIEVILWHIPEDENGKEIIPEESPVPHKCISADISAGGIGILSRSPLKKGELVKCELFLQKDEIQAVVTFKGRVARIIDREKNESYPFAAGIKVDTITQADTSTLLRYSLACQREELRLRLEGKR